MPGLSGTLAHSRNDRCARPQPPGGGTRPLDVSATAVETDAYMDRVTRAGRVYLGSASVRTAGQ